MSTVPSVYFVLNVTYLMHHCVSFPTMYDSNCMDLGSVSHISPYMPFFFLGQLSSDPSRPRLCLSPQLHSMYVPASERIWPSPPRFTHGYLNRLTVRVPAANQPRNQARVQDKPTVAKTPYRLTSGNMEMVDLLVECRASLATAPRLVHKPLSRAASVAQRQRQKSNRRPSKPL